MRRRPGQASIEEHPKGSGRYRVRARVDGKLTTIGSKMRRAEAEERASAYTVLRNERVVRGRLTLGQFGVGFLDRRERAGVRGIRRDRDRWKNLIECDPIAEVSICQMTRRDVIEWRDRLHRRKGIRSGRPLQPQTKRNALNLLRVALAEAVDRELLDANPARDVRFRRQLDDTTEEDLAGILAPEEQARLLVAIPHEQDRALAAFTLYTGARPAEVFWLESVDVHAADGYVVLRYSEDGQPLKNGKPRKAHLLPGALEALTVAARQRHYGQPLVWPGPRGGQRVRRPRWWRHWLRAAGIERDVRWYDLRHTCATSLLAGWWGRKWSLDEVSTMLGHSSTKITERYARRLDSTLAEAVKATKFPSSSQPLIVRPGEQQETSGASFRTRTGDLRFTKPQCLSDRAPAKGARTIPYGNVKPRPLSYWALAGMAYRFGLLPGQEVAGG